MDRQGPRLHLGTHRFRGRFRPRQPVLNHHGPPVPADQDPAIEKKVIAFAGKHFDGIGQCAHGLLDLMLTPGSEGLATKVRARFGPSVQIMVGGTVWNGHPGRSRDLWHVGRTATAPAGYSSVLHLRSRVVKVGANLQGHVAFHNPSTTLTSLSSPINRLKWSSRSRVRGRGRHLHRWDRRDGRGTFARPRPVCEHHNRRGHRALRRRHRVGSTARSL